MKTILTIFILLLVPFFGISQSIEKFSIDSGGASSTVGNIEILYTIGEVTINEFSNGSIQVSEGFINPLQLSISMNPKIILEGPSIGGGLMSDNLRGNNIIPLTSPYPDAMGAMASVFTVTGNDAVVDWVYVSLMDKMDQSVEIASTSGFVQVDGDIVKENGVDALTFDVAADDYYVRIIHRNHLAILTAAPVTLNGGGSTLDLTADPLAIFEGVNAVADLGGIFAMISGDVDSNGQIQNIDVNNVRPQIGVSGYLNIDADMNGQVQNTDINLYIRPNLGRGIQF